MKRHLVTRIPKVKPWYSDVYGPLTPLVSASELSASPRENKIWMKNIKTKPKELRKNDPAIDLIE